VKSRIYRITFSARTLTPGNTAKRRPRTRKWRPPVMPNEKPNMPTILKQWLDFKPNLDGANPVRDPTEHEKELINRRRLVRTAEMKNEITRRQKISVAPIPRPKSSILSEMYQYGRSKTFS